jgi:hypothetical protein
VTTQPKPPSRAAVSGYLVYADGRKVTEVNTATGDHVLLRLSEFIDDPPLFITVRTRTKEGAISADSNVIRVPRSLVSTLPTSPRRTLMRSNTANTLLQQQQLYPVGRYAHTLCNTWTRSLYMYMCMHVQTYSTAVGDMAALPAAAATYVVGGVFYAPNCVFVALQQEPTLISGPVQTVSVLAWHMPGPRHVLEFMLL